MKWPVIGYALLCIVGPMAWGLVVVRLSNWIEERVRRAKTPGAQEEIPPIEYHI